MQILVILFGMDYAKTIAGGSMVFGVSGDVPTRQFTLELPHEMTPTDAAEYAFDLSNNPAREQEREAVFGRETRSLSSGDVVRVNETNLLCLPIGWAEVSEECVAQLEADGTWNGRSEIARSYMQNHA